MSQELAKRGVGGGGGASLPLGTFEDLMKVCKLGGEEAGRPRAASSSRSKCQRRVDLSTARKGEGGVLHLFKTRDFIIARKSICNIFSHVQSVRSECHLSQVDE